jgi:hypothetical protein
LGLPLIAIVKTRPVSQGIEMVSYIPGSRGEFYLPFKSPQGSF